MRLVTQNSLIGHRFQWVAPKNLQIINAVGIGFIGKPVDNSALCSTLVILRDARDDLVFGHTD